MNKLFLLIIASFCHSTFCSNQADREFFVKKYSKIQNTIKDHRTSWIGGAITGAAYSASSIFTNSKIVGDIKSPEINEMMGRAAVVSLATGVLAGIVVGLGIRLCEKQFPIDRDYFCYVKNKIAKFDPTTGSQLPAAYKQRAKEFSSIVATLEHLGKTDRIKDQLTMRELTKARKIRDNMIDKVIAHELSRRK